MKLKVLREKQDSEEEDENSGSEEKSSDDDERGGINGSMTESDLKTLGEEMYIQKPLYEILDDRISKIEIPEEEYNEWFAELNRAYWDILIKFPNTINFGLILLDLEPAKKAITLKIQQLLTRLSTEVIGKFTEKMKSIYDNFSLIESKISASHDSIDAVIMQIEYIKTLSKNEHILEDLEN